jgi:restriction endonuclease Mrr
VNTRRFDRACPSTTSTTLVDSSPTEPLPDITQLSNLAPKHLQLTRQPVPHKLDREGIDLIDGERLTLLLKEYRIGLIVTTRVVEDVTAIKGYFDGF